MPAPTNIRSLTTDGVLELTWSAESVDRLPFRFLRGRCPCAGCVDEITGVRIVDVEHVPMDIKPQDIAFSGNYALKFTWSDGHNTGLYSWEYLQKLSEERISD